MESMYAHPLQLPIYIHHKAIGLSYFDLRELQAIACQKYSKCFRRHA